MASKARVKHGIEKKKKKGKKNKKGPHQAEFLARQLDPSSSSPSSSSNASSLDFASTKKPAIRRIIAIVHKDPDKLPILKRFWSREHGARPTTATELETRLERSGYEDLLKASKLADPATSRSGRLEDLLADNQLPRDLAPVILRRRHNLDYLFPTAFPVMKAWGMHQHPELHHAMRDVLGWPQDVMHSLLHREPCVLYLMISLHHKGTLGADDFYNATKAGLPSGVEKGRPLSPFGATSSDESDKSDDETEG